ncbi:hypothetical protein Glove_171g9 [Diversispora epigaea]|uniref:Restriction endonuclease type IV Mrr domain-containing protein n=1 Tax=Diversispora epigaea TaxID=1348612 RepID=A0A397IY82_9GLOM|nr:hypothetical protein Glove_171g9 [Diversispora epigaea]
MSDSNSIGDNFEQLVLCLLLSANVVVSRPNLPSDQEIDIMGSYHGFAIIVQCKDLNVPIGVSSSGNTWSICLEELINQKVLKEIRELQNDFEKLVQENKDLKESNKDLKKSNKELHKHILQIEKNIIKEIKLIKQDLNEKIVVPEKEEKINISSFNNYLF